VAKLLWVDLETSGLSPFKNGLLSLAALYEEEGTDNSDKCEYQCRPHPSDTINPQALKVNGFTQKQIANFPCPYEVLSTFEGFMRQYIDPYDPTDKFTMCGYNTSFDLRFLNAWFLKHGNDYFYSYFHKETIDVLPMARRYFKTNGISIENNKLVTVAKYFDIEGTFHTAIDDILATFQIYHHVKED